MWNFRFLLSSEVYQLSNQFTFAICTYPNSKVLGKGTISCTNLFAENEKSQAIPVIVGFRGYL